MMKAVWDLKSQFKKYKHVSTFDCMVAEFLLTDGRSVPDLAKTLERYDVQSLEELAQKQMEQFADSPKLHSLFSDIEMPMIGVLWEMEQAGILLDVECLKKVGEDIDTAVSKSKDEIFKHVGMEINLNSSVQVGNYLSEKEGVPLSKTKTGRYSTNANELEQFATEFPIIKKILTYRELTKLRSTYVNSLIDKVDSEGRVHTTYHQTAVSTGRLASTNPNMQNIPVTSEFGKKIKGCFIAPTGKTLVSFDYSQQELRILAHLTGEDALIDAFNTNKDVHTTTASLLFDVEYDKVTKEQRSIAKTVNFGIIYGISSYGLGMGLNIPVDHAQKFIDAFYETYPKIKTYYDNYLRQARIDGYAETLLGRRRYVFEYPKQTFIDNGMKRVLMNYPIQGSAADLMKMAMVRIKKEIVDTDDSVKMLLQIHDDLVFEIDDDKVKIEELIKKVKELMCNVFPLDVPIEVDVKIGKSWGEMETI